MPDEELLALAEQKKLSQPDVAARPRSSGCSTDPKAAAFTENFVGQWLRPARDRLHRRPSHVLYPEFDDMLKVSMVARDGAVLRRSAEERPEPDELRRLRLHDAQRPAGRSTTAFAGVEGLEIPQGAAAAGQRIAAAC